MPSAGPCFDAEQLEDLQSFVKDWLRHRCRTQADLRRALRLSSIRMPVLLEELQRIQQQQGLAALAETLCGVESRWQAEDGEGLPPEEEREDSFAASFGQLDLLLEEIRQERGPAA